MTDEQKKTADWLSRNANIKKTISALEERRERLEASINKAIGSYEASEIQFDRDPKVREGKMCELADLNDLILEKEAELAAIDKETIEVIFLMPDTKERFVLLERYINHKPLQKISKEVYHSLTHTHRIHLKGLNILYPMIKSKIDDEQC